MHGSYRCVVLAAFGWLICLQAEASTPAPKSGVAVASKPERAENDQDQRTAKPTWPRSIDEAEQASKTDCGNAKECRTEQREYSDLRAQWEAAGAARSAERATWHQTWLAAAGVLLLLVTLWITMFTSYRQLRAYVFLSNSDQPHPTPITRNSRLLFAIKNTGHSPALGLKMRRAAIIRHRPIGDEEVELPPASEFIRSLVPGAPLDVFLDLNELTYEHLEMLDAGALVLWRVRIDYKTIFGGRDFEDRTVIFSKEEMEKGNIVTLGQQERERT